MKIIHIGQTGSWFSVDAYYVVYKDKYSNKWIGLAQSVWKANALDYHSSIIEVVQPDGYWAPGSGSGQTNDPYSYLPRDQQTWEYNTNDGDSGRDRLGWYLNSKWVELPKTAVPSTWAAIGTDVAQVHWAFVTDPNCWRPGNPEMRQGVTYNSGSVPPGSYYMEFTVYYHVRPFGWWDCYGGTDAHLGSKIVLLYG